MMNDLILSKETPYQSAQQYVDDRYRDEARRLLLRHWSGCWYRWADGCYHEADTDEFRPGLWSYLDGAKRYGNADKDGGAKLTAYSPKRNDVAELEAAIQGLPSLCVPRSVELPAWIGADEPAGPLIPLENGLLSVSRYLTGDGDEVLPHSPDYFALHKLPLPYDPGAECPTWDRFLEEVFEGDVERIESLHEWVGYNLTTETRYQKLMVLYGVPRSGKSTVSRIMAALVGPRNVAHPTLRDLTETYGLWGLHGKLSAIIGDGCNVKDAMPLVERLKGIVGEDTVTIQRKYLPPVECRLKCRFTIVMNDLPRFPDASAAIMKRVLLIPFNKSFAGSEDWDLEAKLRAELPGVLNRCLDGLRRLTDRGGFVQCQAGNEALGEMDKMTGGAKAFALDSCLVGDDYEMLKCDLIVGYKSWCERERREQMGQTAFFRQLYSAFPGLKDHRTRPRDESGKQRNVEKIKGIRLTDDSTDYLFKQFQYEVTGERIDREAERPTVAA